MSAAEPVSVVAAAPLPIVMAPAAADPENALVNADPATAPPPARANCPITLPAESIFKTPLQNDQRPGCANQPVSTS